MFHPFVSPDDVICYAPEIVAAMSAGTGPVLPRRHREGGLTPVDGLVLTAQGAAKLLEVLVPSGGGASAAHETTPETPGSAVLSPEMRNMIHKIHFQDRTKELPVGYAFTCPAIAHLNDGCCFSLGSASLSSQGSVLGARQGCQALITVLTHSACGLVVLANTAEAVTAGNRHNDGGGEGFCRQVIGGGIFPPCDLPPLSS